MPCQRISRRNTLALLGTGFTGVLAGCQDGGFPTTQPNNPSTDRLYVGPNGSDQNQGTKEAPFETIQRAVKQAQPGQTVYVTPGKYFEFVEFREDGEPDAPITLTGPPDAVLKPPKEIDHSAVAVGGSHVHITGLTISGLYDAANPDYPASYHSDKLISLNPWAETSDDYLDGLVISPHQIGNAGQSLINSVQIKDSEIGGFKVIGPAGTKWILDDTEGHNGEIVYLGTAPDNRRERGYDEYDRTRNIRVHHIDNREGHPHSELVDCKAGVENITVEYCTDGGGAQSGESYYQPAISLDGYRCTIRWNIIQNVEGSCIRIGPQNFLEKQEFPPLPQTEFEKKFGKEHAIYGNVFTGYTRDAVNFLRESIRPGLDSNPLPTDQRALCGNLFDAYSDHNATESCPSGVPPGDGVGYRGGESPSDSNKPSKEEVFEQNATDPNLELTAHRDTAPLGGTFEAPVTITNTADTAADIVVRLRTRGYVMAEKSGSISPGSERQVNLSGSGLPEPREVAVTLNGQKVASIWCGERD